MRSNAQRDRAFHNESVNLECSLGIWIDEYGQSCDRFIWWGR